MMQRLDRDAGEPREFMDFVEIAHFHPSNNMFSSDVGAESKIIFQKFRIDFRREEPAFPADRVKQDNSTWAVDREQILCPVLWFDSIFARWQAAAFAYANSGGRELCVISTGNV